MLPILRPSARTLLVSLAFLAASPHAGRQWTEIAGPGSEGEFQAVSSTPAGWIAVGTQGLIRHSTDGKIWRIVEGQLVRRYDSRRRLVAAEHPAGTNLPRCDWNGIATLGQTVAIVGDSGTIATTRDAQTWTVERIGDSTDLLDIASDGSRLVAVGSKGAVLRSADGATWTRALVPGSSNLRQVIHAGAEFLAIGADGNLYASPDGIVWTDRSVDSLMFLEIGWKPGGQVALARVRQDPTSIPSSPRAFWSVDASTWTAARVDSLPSYDPVLSGIVVDDSAWFLSDERGSLRASNDGRSWTAYPSRIVGGATHAAHDRIVGRSPGTWIAPIADAMGSRLSALASSTNRGSQWRPVSTITGTPSAGVRVKGIFRYPDGWWILRNDQVIGLVAQTLLHSPDLARWDGSVAGGGYANRVDLCAGIPTAWGSGDVLQFDFAQRSMIARNPDMFISSWQAFACGDGEMLSLGHRAGTTGTKVLGAVQWTGSADSIRFDIPKQTDWKALRRFGGRWIGLSVKRDTTFLHTSADGRDWQQSVLSDSVAMADLASSGATLVAVGPAGMVMRSQDGAHWETISLDRYSYFTQAFWTGTLFVAASSYGNLAISRDGRSWSLDTLPKPVPGSFATATAVAHSGDTLIVGTSEGRLFLTVDPSLSLAARRPSVAPIHVLRQGDRFLAQVDASLAGPWIVYDVDGRRRARAERIPGTDRIAVDAKGLGRGVFILRGAGIEARLVSP